MIEIPMNTSQFKIDLELFPTTFDAIHAYLAATVFGLALTVIILLFAMLIGLLRRSKKPAESKKDKQEQAISMQIPKREPEVKVVEKIVEVEKIVQQPAPEPIILKEATPDAALQLLSLLQKEARLIDFLQEDINDYSDADVGAAVRVVHTGCNKALKEHFTLTNVRTEEEGSKVTLKKGFNSSEVRLIGNIVGEAPFSGTLVHKGWQVTNIKLPKLTEGHNANIIAAAEVEL
jgi:hypothetical protein